MFHIYGKDTCSYCWKARKMLDDYGHKYIYEEVTHAKDSSVYKQKAKIWNHRTVPLITNESGAFIGGYDELKEELGAHTKIEAVTWWLVTIWKFFTCKCTYRTRMHERNTCAMNVYMRKNPQYLSGRGK